MANLGVPRAASASGARRRSRSSRRAARRSRSGAGRRVAADPRGGRASCARRPRRPRPRGLAEDVGLARHPHHRAHRRRVELRPGAARGAGAGARGRAARARRSRPASGGRKSATACSSTTTRTPRTARSRARTRCARKPDARVSAPLTWDELDAASPRTSRCARCRRASRASAIGTPTIDAHPCSLDALLELSARDEGDGEGDAPWPPHYPEAGRRAAACSQSVENATTAGGRRASTSR